QLENWLGPRMPPPTVDGKTLWDRLGGKEGVTKIVGEFVDDIIKDQGVNFSRGGKYKMTPDRVDHVKRMMVELASETMGGLDRYTGKPMALAHAGMDIKDEEFTTCLSRLKMKLMRNERIGEADRKKVLSFVESTRSDIVGGKKAPKQGVIPPPPPQAGA